MLYFTHPIESVASFWQLPSSPQINEKIQLFPTIWNRAICDKMRIEGNLYPISPAVREIWNILGRKMTNSIVQRILKRKGKLCIKFLRMPCIYQTEKAEKLFFD